MEFQSFLGVDLAWGERNRSGLAAVDADGRLVDLAVHRTDEEILAWLRPWAERPCLVAVDAPLIVRNPTGRRPCEAQLDAVFGRYDAGTYPTNTGRREFVGGGRAARLVGQLGLDADPRSTSHRRAVEVYPHAAAVALFGLPRIVKYKHKRGRSLESLRSESARLVRLLESLEHADPVLRLGDHAGWAAAARAVAGAERKSELRAVEDMIDAVVCAYVALLSVRRPDRTTVFGDDRDGYIVTPTLGPGHPPPSGRSRARMGDMQTPRSIASIHPRLAVDDAPAALEYYTSALGAVEQERHELDGKIVHALILIDGHAVALKDQDDVDRSPRSLGGTPVVLSVEVADADAVADRMVGAGGTVVFAVDDHGYGYRDGRVEDPFGHQWIVSQPLA